MPTGLRIDVLCTVIDNFGDAGICWRLARQLVDEARARVTLWIDQPAILDAWRPQGPAITVRDSAELKTLAPGDLFIATLGSRVDAVTEQRLADAGTLWMRYEYLTAEAWVDGCHGLLSLRPHGGQGEWYFYPGFTPASGGLLREAGLWNRQAAFHGPSAARWLADHGLVPPTGRLRACLFGYGDERLATLVRALVRRDRPTDVLLAEGLHRAIGSPAGSPNVHIHPHRWLAQDDFDQLLWSSDLNLVRGEESWVRAQWAGQPFLWQPYAQPDGLHLVKLDAFLERLLTDAPSADAEIVRLAMHALAGNGDIAATVPPFVDALARLRPLYTRWRARLVEQPSLMQRLSRFVADRL
ncbi:MAG: elongation factor P maturation arginine rhamnosyltransferase EarP [Burkholderiaceae bacterium]